MALREKSLLKKIKSLKSQLAAKEKERIETVEALHDMESKCISIGAKLETKTEDFDNLKKDLDKIVKEKNILRRSMLRKIKIFMISAIVCGNCAKIAMISLVRSQEILAGGLGSLTHSLLGYAVNMRICQLSFRLVPI